MNEDFAFQPEIGSFIRNAVIEDDKFRYYIDLNSFGNIVAASSPTAIINTIDFTNSLSSEPIGTTIELLSLTPGGVGGTARGKIINSCGPQS